ncbi:protein kinase domain-containing protein [Actinomadura scrupuli]|uniref:protein kinase domain-containing protein n=1 Tax=Actinomadura scrupuli TaxID=559629 RepID=UPI003D986D71
MESQRRAGAAGPLLPQDPERVGSYTILGRIGEGGMGAVYLGRAPDGRKVAVKVVRSELARDAGFVARFQDEVANAQRVASFCTAQVLDHGESDGRAYMVTEFIDGVSLLEYVNENGQLSPGMLQGVAVGVAAALVAIHSAGLIHRDLKPANVLLSYSGPRVIDFGIARALDAATNHTMTGQLVGSPGWMAPEQILQQPVTTAVDIFSWGCLVAYAANGINPFGRGDFSVMSARLLHGDPQVGVLPAPLDRLVRSALDKDPRNRPSAKDLLLTMVGGESAEAAVLGTLTPSWQPPVPPGAQDETRPAEEPTQARRPSSPGVPAPYPVPSSAPTPASGQASPGYGSARTDPLQGGPGYEAAPTNLVGAPTLPAGPPHGHPAGAPPFRPPGQGRRRALLAAAVAAILAAGLVTGGLILTSGGTPTPKSSGQASAGPAALPADPLLVRVDTRPGWPKDCYGNIGLLKPMATTPTVLLDAPGKCDILPQWSPDHQRIAFTRFTDPGAELWVMNADASAPRMISDRLAGKTRVAWSKDGTRIAGMGKQGSVSQIFVFDLGAPGSPKQITTDGSNKDDPAWCGSKLAFWSDKGGTQQIYTTDAATAGGAWTQVTHEDHSVNDPAWSPDCSKIAYTDQPNKDDRHIWVIGADGSGKTQLTPDATRDMDPNWSKDGTWIAFVRGSTQHPKIWAVRANGKDELCIAPKDRDIGHPDWY